MTGYECDILIQRCRNKLREPADNPINEGINECIRIISSFYQECCKKEINDLYCCEIGIRNQNASIMSNYSAYINRKTDNMNRGHNHEQI